MCSVGTGVSAPWERETRGYRGEQRVPISCWKTVAAQRGLDLVALGQELRFHPACSVLHSEAMENPSPVKSPP